MENAARKNTRGGKPLWAGFYKVGDGVFLKIPRPQLFGKASIRANHIILENFHSKMDVYDGRKREKVSTIFMNGNYNSRLLNQGRSKCVTGCGR